jgi:tetratricopeptide (TPR) repeat protein
MNDAERLFYAGQYAEAVKKYDQVLSIERDWERAREHRNQADKYLLEGRIPAVALPPEAAILFGKAQSAARVGRYKVALELIVQAKDILNQMGIRKWAEGQEFEVQLQTNIEAEEVAMEGVRLFSQGKFDEAIEKVEMAFQATQLPKYKDWAEKYRQFKVDYKDISDTIFMGMGNPDAIIRVLKKLDTLSSEHDEHPSLQTLRNRLQNIIPSITEVLNQEIRGLKTQAERAATIDAALVAAQQAKSKLEQAVRLGIPDVSLARLNQEINNIISKLSQLENSLERSEDAYLRHRTWPSEAWVISAEVRERFPGDPRVLDLQNKLSGYKVNQVVLRVAAVLVLIIFLSLGGFWGVSRFNAYQLALTPTVTLTPSPTATATLPPTATATLTPLPPTATATPTPPFGFVTRRVWLRNGCYEEFKTIETIPENSSVTLLPLNERAFDYLNRECIFVEYNGPKGHLIGWILLQDFRH